MDREKLIKQIMAECEKDDEPITKEEAAEMAEMELRAKQDCRRYESDKTARKKPQREKKIDEEKVKIMDFLFSLLKYYNLITEKQKITIINPQQEIAFMIGENSYSIKLVKHRKRQGE